LKNNPFSLYKYLVWDVDGTLFDSYPCLSDSLWRACHDFNILLTREQAMKMAKNSLEKTINQLADEYDINREDMVERFRWYFHHIPAERQPPFPGVIAVCRWRRDSGGQNFIYTHRHRQTLGELLVFYQMTDLFSDMVTGDDGYASKPDPAGLLTLMAEHDLPASDVLMIGDREMDVLVGKAAGVHTCLFGENIISAQPDYHLTDYRILLA
jgi:HAD superfamily hydrolase (TIGR01509 family)